MWDDGTPGFEALAPDIVLLPFNQLTEPLSDLERRALESCLATAPAGLCLAVHTDQAAILTAGAAALPRERLRIVAASGDNWLLAEGSSSEARFWCLLFELLSDLGSSDCLVLLAPSHWGLTDWGEEDLARLEADFLALSMRGVHIALFNKGAPDPLRCFALPQEDNQVVSLPCVSVIMPVFNAERFLLEAIASVLDQSFVDLELICIDDGSSDSSLKLLEDAATLDHRIRVYSQANAGVSRTRNRGLDLARGRYITFADADDKLFPGSLERRMALLEQEGELICGGRAIFLDEDGRDLGMSYGRLNRAWFQHSESVPFHITTITGRHHIMKRQRFPEGVAHAEDWAYIVGLLSDGWSIASCGEEPLVGYRWHENSATATNREGHFNGCFSFLESLVDRQPLPSANIERPGNALQLPTQKVNNALAQRLQSHFVVLALIGDHVGLEAHIKRLDQHKFPRRPGWFNRRYFDVAAIRAFRLPKGSSELERAICARLDTAFDACGRLPPAEGHRRFSLAFRRYLISIAERNEDDNCTSLLKRRMVVERDAVVLWIRTTARRCRRAVLGRRG